MSDESCQIGMHFPRGETGVWNEVIFWSILSCFRQSINLMAIFYRYLIASHPNIVLFIYFILYCLSAKYIFDLGGLLNNVGQYDDGGKIGCVRRIYLPDPVPVPDPPALPRLDMVGKQNARGSGTGTGSGR